MPAADVFFSAAVIAPQHQERARRLAHRLVRPPNHRAGDECPAGEGRPAFGRRRRRREQRALNFGRADPVAAHVHHLVRPAVEAKVRQSAPPPAAIVVVGRRVAHRRVALHVAASGCIKVASPARSVAAPAHLSEAGAAPDGEGHVGWTAAQDTLAALAIGRAPTLTRPQRPAATGLGGSSLLLLLRFPTDPHLGSDPREGPRAAVGDESLAMVAVARAEDNRPMFRGPVGVGDGRAQPLRRVAMDGGVDRLGA